MSNPFALAALTASLTLSDPAGVIDQGSIVRAPGGHVAGEITITGHLEDIGNRSRGLIEGELLIDIWPELELEAIASGRFFTRTGGTIAFNRSVVPIELDGSPLGVRQVRKLEPGWHELRFDRLFTGRIDQPLRRAFLLDLSVPEPSAIMLAIGAGIAGSILWCHRAGG